jgi:hypothetical protein
MDSENTYRAHSPFPDYIGGLKRFLIGKFTILLSASGWCPVRRRFGAFLKLENDGQYRAGKSYEVGNETRFDQ